MEHKCTNTFTSVVALHMHTIPDSFDIFDTLYLIRSNIVLNEFKHMRAIFKLNRDFM